MGDVVFGRTDKLQPHTRLNTTGLEETLVKKVSRGEKGVNKGEKGESAGFGWESRRNYLPVRNGKSVPAADCP